MNTFARLTLYRTLRHLIEPVTAYRLAFAWISAK